MKICGSAPYKLFGTIQPGSVFSWPKCDRVLSSPATNWIKVGGLSVGEGHTLDAVAIDGTDVLMGMSADTQVLHYPTAVLFLDASLVNCVTWKEG